MYGRKNICIFAFEKQELSPLTHITTTLRLNYMIMNKWIFTLITLVFSNTLGCFAQDDLYFVPSKKKVKKQEMPTYESVEYDNWADGRDGVMDIDTYNRRGNITRTDSARYYDETDESNSYTNRIVRFHAPGITVVSSPYYADYIDIYASSWYSPYPSYGWYGFGWHHSWYNPWWGSPYYWNSYCYDPWWGWHNHFYPIHYPGHHHGWYPSYIGHYPHYYPSRTEHRRPATTNRGYRPSTERGTRPSAERRPSQDRGKSSTNRNTVSTDRNPRNSSSTSFTPSRNERAPQRTIGNGSGGSRPQRSMGGNSGGRRR